MDSENYGKGFFIAIEGIDGAGCTTISRFLANQLRRKGYNIILTKEPTKNKIGRLIRFFLKEKNYRPEIDALLFAADRLCHIDEVIGPSLRKGLIVISDRYLESSIAYQTAQGVNQEWIQELNKFAIKPNLTIVLDADPEVTSKRKKGFGGEKFEDVRFLRKVKRKFIERAMQGNYIIIDANSPLKDVQRETLNLVLSFLSYNF